MIDRSLGTHKGPVALYRRPPLELYARVRGDGAVALYSCRCILIMDVEPLGPNTSFIFLFVLVSLLSSPFVWSQVPSFVPKRRRQRGVVGLRVRATLALFPQIRPFIGPTRHLIGQFLHHVISSNIKRRPR